ncbi:MAG TPA: L-seryl-tRNA(Sec) selenium transferase [Gemmatimonadaceae bacterium]|nr:L-seryl-tRNA(Sec) selenium transferase [Gemmatimonadaceae bacterium]
MSDRRRELPSVSALLETSGVRALLEEHSRESVVDAIRVTLASARADDHAGMSGDDWTDDIAGVLRAASIPSLRRVHNATGVIIHTNLGRAPLADAALAAIQNVCGGFSNLEYDIETGKRGSRYSHCVSLLAKLTGAEDALVVNNCAAALVLSLNALARRKEVLVSRGELVEIGGSFRIPDIMGSSGARLVEVGTTNRTHDDDYRRAITPKTAAIVKVHRSNFTISGFTSDVSVESLVFIAREHGLAVVHDLGSGLMLDLGEYGLGGEPTARSAVAAGPALVLMSGDKLLGGPQCGIILGEKSAIGRLRTNPFARAMRVDKLTLAALEATLRLYTEPAKARREIPVLAMLTTTRERVRARTERLAAELKARGVDAGVIDTAATVGGGAFPGAALDSSAVFLGAATRTEQKLRLGNTAVIGRFEEDRLLLDLRSVPERDDAELARAVLESLT